MTDGFSLSHPCFLPALILSPRPRSLPPPSFSPPALILSPRPHSLPPLSFSPPALILSLHLMLSPPPLSPFPPSEARHASNPPQAGLEPHGAAPLTHHHSLPLCFFLPPSRPLPSLHSQFVYHRGTQFVYHRGTQVTLHKLVVNLMVPSPQRHLKARHPRFHTVFHRLVHQLPLFLPLAPLLPKLVEHDARFLVHEKKYLHSLALHILGGDPSRRALVLQEEAQHLIFVERLVQPFFQHCSRPSPALWRSLRSSHLLPPAGLPVFDKDWRRRVVAPVPATVEEAAAEAGGVGTGAAAGELEASPIPKEDWVVINAQPPGVLELERAAEHEAALKDNFWFGRIQQHLAGKGFEPTRKLFSRAALLVTTPGEALLNMIFMPPGATVFEYQPRESATNSHRAFAHVLAFCERVLKNRRMVVVGDSKQFQLTTSLMNALATGVRKPAWGLIQDIEAPEGCAAVLDNDPTRYLHDFCRSFVFNSTLCPGFRLDYIRADRLYIFDPRPPEFEYMPWVLPALSHLATADIILLNRGAHWTATEDFLSGVRSATRYIRQHYPDKLVIYRNTPPGHIGCAGQEAPLEKPQPQEILPYFWKDLREQNELVKEVVEEAGGVYMDVEGMLALRWDGHKGVVPDKKQPDCLHYCLPGPLDVYPQFLYNLLVRLLPPPPPSK
ncbi:unnamed protein product [Closterium sp. Naga37s-1]|nr:unnamed protein product [Closterium sp. Naga37s-1]